MKWTDKQLDIINTRNRNILVSAAAGSGKTAVLVERIVSLITDERENIDVDQLLVLTFTRAAASEMKEHSSGTVRPVSVSMNAGSNGFRRCICLYPRIASPFIFPSFGNQGTGGKYAGQGRLRIFPRRSRLRCPHQSGLFPNQPAAMRQRGKAPALSRKAAWAALPTVLRFRQTTSPACKKSIGLLK